RSIGAIVSAAFMTLFALPFLIAEFVVLGVLSQTFPVIAMGALVLALIVNAVFFHLLKAPTHLGRAVLDEIEGFQRYLSTAESNLVKGVALPDQTPRYYENILPFAIALDLENAWGNKINAALTAIADENRTPGKPLQPSWYRGGRWSDVMSDAFATRLGDSVAAAVTSAARSPSSSSGSGGGGFSGGGGGGGGGGGW
ncbi:MAG: DUF2207 domain-containing protein, partial [Pseudomonadota bacterium]